MGILSKMTSSASMGINLGAMLAKHLSMATLSALDTTLQTTKEVSELAFEYVDDTVPMLDEILTKSGLMGDTVTNMAFLGLVILAKTMPGQILHLVRTFKLIDNESVDKTEELIDSIIKIIETGDLKTLEDTIGDILEAGLFGVTVLQPNILLILFFVKSAIINSALAMVERGLVEEEEATMRARNTCAKIWRLYGKVYHGQEWEGLENIPEDDGALIIYYHGAVPVDYFGLVAEIWLRQGRAVSSVVDRSLMQIPLMENFRNHFKLFPGTVDSCAELLESGELLGIAPGGAYESLFGDSNYPVLWQSRLGFARVALKANKPIIPVFTENIREATMTLAGRMTAGRGMWEYLYKTTKMPVVPMYGLFPVKLKTHIGSPIYPTPGMTPEELAKLTVEAIEGMISQHQVLPGNLGQALVGRIDTEGRLSRSHSKNNLAELTRNNSNTSMAGKEEGRGPSRQVEENMAGEEKKDVPKFVISGPEFEREE